MKVRYFEFTNDYGRSRVRVEFYEHKCCFFTSELDSTKKNVLSAKLNILEEYNKKNGFTKIERKEVLKAWAKVDEQIAEYYKKEYPHGGARANGGRPKGSIKTTPKTERTERFTNAITKEEKEYLGICLEWYRNIKQYNPELLDKILAEYRQYGTFLYTKPLDGKLRTINKE